MLTEMIFGIQKAQVGIVMFDATLNETHSDTAEVTEHPVEFGADVSDNIRMMPATLELEGIVSSTPIVFLASITAPSPLENKLQLYPTRSYDRPGDAYDELRRAMREDGGGITVSTTLRTYENMAITSLEANRDAENGNVLHVSISLREVKKVSPLQYGLDMSPAVPQNPAQKAADNAGNLAAQQAEDAQSDTAMQALLGSIGL
ncbi:MAG: hypothetical protein PHE55_08890 [Methylococcaceae bacterium]|nr:hypothetical protein [Methylococcaceae bacterium]